MLTSTATLALALALQASSSQQAAQAALVELLNVADPAAGRERALSVTKHELRHADGAVRYTAMTGRLPLLDDDGEARAHVSFTAYLSPGDPTSRPITFVYNGGPGSASLWLHLGGLGPMRVSLGPDGEALAPNGAFVDNQYSWLPFTDLVFIDPVGTGYSRPAEGHKQAEFSGYREDIESVGDFIKQLVDRLHRWGSPKYLAGESYGTMRSAGLSGYLQGRHHMFLNGILLISTVLDYGTKRFAPGHDLPYALHLPSFAATAWHHRQLPEALQKLSLRKLLDEVEAFALGDYLLALAQGDRLVPNQRSEIAARLAGYIGTSTQFVLRTDLRVSLGRFTKELRRDEGYTVGRLDSRFVGQDRDDAGETYEFDPSMANIDGPFSSAVNDYVGRRLRYSNDLVYESMSRKVRPWSFAEFENGFVNSADTLRSAMTQNPKLKVLVLSGYYDLATPYFAADYTFSHMGLPAELRDNLQVRYYESGHMMYIHQPSLERMHGDVAAFY